MICRMFLVLLEQLGGPGGHELAVIQTGDWKRRAKMDKSRKHNSQLT